MVGGKRNQKRAEKFQLKLWLAQKQAEDKRTVSNNLMQLGTLILVGIGVDELFRGKLSIWLTVTIIALVIVIYLYAIQMMRGGDRIE